MGVEGEEEGGRILEGLGGGQFWSWILGCLFDQRQRQRSFFYFYFSFSFFFSLNSLFLNYLSHTSFPPLFLP